MVTFVQDTFTDTNGVTLENHTGETGAIWTVHPTGTAGAAEIQSNHLERGASDTGVYLASGTPGSADYSVEVVITRNNEVGNVFPGVIGRADDTAETWYYLRYDGPTDNFILRRINAGSSIILDTAFDDVIGAGNSRTMRLEMEGTTIRAVIDGVTRISVTDDGVDSISDAGSAGIRFVGAGTGWEMDTFASETFTTVPVFANHYNQMMSG